MKVLHLGAGNIYGGIERALVAYAAGRMAYPGMEPLFGIAFPGQFEAELRAEGVDVTTLGPARLSRWSSILSARSKLQTVLTRCRPDLVLAHGPWAYCVFGPAARRAGVPLALFFHNPPTLTGLDMFARLKRPDLALANSAYTLRRARWWLGQTSAVVCTPPIFRPCKVERLAARAKLDVAPDQVIVLQASRLDPYKGHRLHLHALAELKARSDWSAWFAGATLPGKESYGRSLVALRDSLGLKHRVHFLGHRTDVCELMAAADVFCQPNLRPEPFGLVFVEAMHAGLPVITTRMGAAEEILASGGGLLVSPTRASLATTLQELIRNSDRRTEIGRLGRELSAVRYPAESGVQALGACLSAFIRDRPEGGRVGRWA